MNSIQRITANKKRNLGKKTGWTSSETLEAGNWMNLRRLSLRAAFKAWWLDTVNRKNAVVGARASLGQYDGLESSHSEELWGYADILGGWLIQRPLTECYRKHPQSRSCWYWFFFFKVITASSWIHLIICKNDHQVLHCLTQAPVSSGWNQILLFWSCGDDSITAICYTHYLLKKYLMDIHSCMHSSDKYKLITRYSSRH